MTIWTVGLAGLVKVKSVNTGMANVAGVTIPTFESIETDVKEVDAWSTPAWVDNAVDTTTQILSLQCERSIYQEQKALIEKELQLTSRSAGRRSARSRSRSAMNRPRR